MITTKNRLVDLRRNYRVLQQLDLPPMDSSVLPNES
jgi:hypothetical protein